MATDSPELETTLDCSYERALETVPAALKTEGFGVLTEIDVKSTLKEKLDIDFKKYKILGACNPPLAHKALEADLDIGLMLPCNVIVYEVEPGKTMVKAVDPEQTLASTGTAGLDDIASEVKARLVRVIQQL